MKPIVWVSNDRAIRAQLINEPVIVRSAVEFLDVPRTAQTVSFIDGEALETLDRYAYEVTAPDHVPTPEWRKLVGVVSIAPIIAVCDAPLATAIGWLPSHPWLSHVIGRSLLDTSYAKGYLANVIELCSTREPSLLDWLQADSGRRVKLTHASRGVERLKRMGQWFADHEVEGQQIVALTNIADELLVNAFYEAPVAAGASKRIERSRDVGLPDDYACDIAYGCTDDLAVVFVRDPFGSLLRERLVDALTRGDSGFGRVFAAASIAAVSVHKNVHTEVFVAVPKRYTQTHPFAFHLLFKETARRHLWKLIDDDTGNGSSGRSITLIVE